jgi:AhpD family alkylhydroperoxidase
MTSTAPTPDAVTHKQRIDLPRLARESYRAMLAVERTVELDTALSDLINIRVSQLNGCAFCLDMHGRDAREHGATDQRLDTLAGWRESPFFTAPERAALGLAEAMTKLTDGPVPDVVYEEAARHFDEHALAQIIFAVTVINAWNRIAVTAQMQAPTR